MATSFQLSPLTFHKLVWEQPSSQPSRININFYDASCFFIVVFKACTKIRKRFSYRFSAFWLKSCVVSVLVSLISGMLGIACTNINLIFTSRVNTEACFSWLTDCPSLTLLSGAVNLKILNLQITLIEWRCQYEESNWAWWIARTAITCPKNLRLPNFSISIVRTSSNLGGMRKWTNFVEPVQSYEFLKARWCQKVKPNRAWCKKRKFQNFCSFLSKFYFFNIVSQFWTQKNSNEPKTTSLASVFVE